MILRLFHRTGRESAGSILREGFEDRPDPTGRNHLFYDEVPEIKAPWFSNIPLDDNAGAGSWKLTGRPSVNDVLFLIEIPDEVVQQHPEWEVFVEGRPFTEYIIPAEVANQYGPPIDVTDMEGDLQFS